MAKVNDLERDYQIETHLTKCKAMLVACGKITEGF